MMDWNNIDTVLLDMDGTLLDLNYDNHIWNNMLPQRVARRTHGDVPLTRELIEDASQDLLTHMRSIAGTIDYYSLPYWAARTGLDLISLHEEFAHLLRYRPSAERFLERLGSCGINRVIATNAHRDSLTVKNARSNIVALVDLCISSHDYGHPKETPDFWQAMQTAIGFEPSRTLFIDDNDNVLKSAEAFGIEHLLTITQPDSDQPPKTELNYPAFNDFANIMPEDPASASQSA